MQTKIGHLIFDHSEEFRGNVEIKKGDISLTIPMDALRAFVAESVRCDLLGQVQKMKPADLLRRIS